MTLLVKTKKVASGTLLLLSTALFSSCVVVDAPETMEELVVFGFVNFDREESYLQATVENLIPLAEENLEQLRDGYYVDLLENEDLDQAGVDAPDVEGIIGALGSADYRHDLDSVIELQTRPNKDELYPNIFEYQVSDVDGDRTCFLSRLCRRFEATIYEEVDLPVVGTSTTTHRRGFRWVTLTDGTDVVCSRAINAEGVEFSTNIVEVHQQYSLYCMYPSQDNTRRIEAIWVDAYLLGTEVPLAWAVDQVVGEMQNSADNVSDLIDES